MYNSNLGGQPGGQQHQHQHQQQYVNHMGPQSMGQQPPFSNQANPFGNPFYGPGSGLVRSGLSAYGEKILGSSSEYVQSNISRYFADPQYYFQVNDDYVRNKLKVVLFPFLHRGHWTRITEPMAGKLSYKPPIYDINAPDLYIPLMAFLSYVVLGGLVLGLSGKFNPEAVNWLFMKGMVGWFLQVTLLKLSLFSLSSGEAPLLDVVAYAGYAFTGTQATQDRLPFFGDAATLPNVPNVCCAYSNRSRRFCLFRFQFDHNSLVIDEFGVDDSLSFPRLSPSLMCCHPSKLVAFNDGRIYFVSGGVDQAESYSYPLGNRYIEVYAERLNQRQILRRCSHMRSDDDAVKDLQLTPLWSRSFFGGPAFHGYLQVIAAFVV